MSHAPLRPTADARDPALDGLRGVAILLVVLFHAWGYAAAPGNGADAFLNGVIGGGYLGVDLFFVLSGFLITGILLDARGGEGYLRNFYARRALRIFPLYYAFLAMAWFVLPMAAHLTSEAWADVPGSPWPFVFYTSNLAFGRHGNFFGGDHFHATWSLAVEEQFYLVWPFVVLLVSPRWLWRLCIVLAVGSVAARAALLSGGWGWVAAYVLPVARCDGLALGAMLATMRCVGAGAQRPRLVPAGLTVGGASLLLLVTAVEGSLRGTSAVTIVAAPAGASLLSAGVLATLVGENGGTLRRWFCLRSLVHLGQRSYGLYLLHLPVVAALGVPLSGLVGWRPAVGAWLPQALHAAAALTASLLVAEVSWRCFESPILRLKRHFAPPAAPIPLPSAAAHRAAA